MAVAPPPRGQTKGCAVAAMGGLGWAGLGWNPAGTPPPEAPALTRGLRVTMLVFQPPLLLAVLEAVLAVTSAEAASERVWVLPRSLRTSVELSSCREQRGGSMAAMASNDLGQPHALGWADAARTRGRAWDRSASHARVATRMQQRTTALRHPIAYVGLPASACAWR